MGWFVGGNRESFLGDIVSAVLYSIPCVKFSPCCAVGSVYIYENNDEAMSHCYQTICTFEHILVHTPNMHLDAAAKQMKRRLVAVGKIARLWQAKFDISESAQNHPQRALVCIYRTVLNCNDAIKMR